MINRSNLILAINLIFNFLFSLIVLISVNFIILKSLPGGPFDSETMLHPLVKEQFEKSFGDLNSFWTDLSQYIQLILSGSFGHSMVKTDRTVWSLIESSFQQTFVLNLMALIIIYLFGFFFSLLAIFKKNTWVENALDQFALCFISTPSLFIGPVLIYFFSIKISLLPLAFLDKPIHYLLPIATLSLRPIAFLYRCLKQDLSRVMQSNFVRYAQAKGLDKWQIIYRHGLLNSLETVVNYSSTLIIGTLSGSLLVEVMFSIHGMATEFLFALENRDYPVISGMVLLSGTILYILTTIFDMIRIFFDPRQRFQE